MLQPLSLLASESYRTVAWRRGSHTLPGSPKVSFQGSQDLILLPLPPKPQRVATIDLAAQKVFLAGLSISFFSLPSYILLPASLLGGLRRGTSLGIPYQVHSSFCTPPYLYSAFPLLLHYIPLTSGDHAEVGRGPARKQKHFQVLFCACQPSPRLPP